MEFSGPLPRLNDLDGGKTQEKIDLVFTKYRYYKSITFEEREASTTASYSDIPRSYTGTTSDQTANIAIYNVDEPEARQNYIDRIEKAVRKLPFRLRNLIEKRYMQEDDETDFNVYTNILEISRTKYTNMRFEAFYRIVILFHELRILNIRELVKEG